MATPCQFLANNQQFAGSPADQARCLLRRVKVAGNVDDTPAQIPDKLLAIVGQPATVTLQQLQSYLTFKGISAADIGGDLSKGVSSTSKGTKASYFIIHDTSDELSGNSFPATVNTAAWSGNDLAKRSTNSAHIFINRLGQSATGHNYSVAWRATKIERDPAMKGLFLHHELIQPRIKGGFKFAAVGPMPGFTQETMDRLALCYIAAAVRRGSFLIPAFHCVLDLGIKDGHDDPQNFDLFQWVGSIEKILSEIQTPVGAHAVLAVAMEAIAPQAVAVAAAPPPTAAPPELETVRDAFDGKRHMPVRRIKGTTPLFFKAKMSIDADGAARAYHPDSKNPESLDNTGNATSESKKFIQGQKMNGKTGKGPRPGFFVSATRLQHGDDFDANAFVDAEFVPYIVLPGSFAADVAPGDICTVVNMKNLRTTSAIFADTNPRVGEASIRTALNLHVHDPSFPITKMARAGGDDGANYVYIVYPNSRFTPRADAPHWPAEQIEETASPLFEAFGGLDMVRRLFPLA
jgi:hypothetical protein